MVQRLIDMYEVSENIEQHIGVSSHICAVRLLPTLANKKPALSREYARVRRSIDGCVPSAREAMEGLFNASVIPNKTVRRLLKMTDEEIGKRAILMLKATYRNPYLTEDEKLECLSNDPPLQYVIDALAWSAFMTGLINLAKKDPLKIDRQRMLSVMQDEFQKTNNSTKESYEYVTS
jgi:hypothetical protein